jgi:hypothetical protein
MLHGITLSQHYILRTLVESMPGRRVKAILKSKGHTKY